jgi:hypothetical protein
LSLCIQAFKIKYLKQQFCKYDRSILMNYYKYITSLVAAIVLLVGCGGGSGDSTPPTVAGTYIGTIYKLSNAIKYTGPASMTINSSNAMAGTWTISPENSSGPLPTYVVNLSGTVDSAGVLTANGAIGSTTNVMPMTGTVDKVTGKVTASYTYSGGVSPFTGEFTLVK